MERKFYICGNRPVIVEIHQTYDNYLTFNWETKKFEENFQYSHQISYDPEGNMEEVTEQGFNACLEEIEKESKVSL